MAKIVELKSGDQTILVEASDLGYQGGVVSAGATDVAQKHLDKMLEIVRPFSESLLNTFESLSDRKPDSATAEFGIGISGEGNLFFAKLSADVNIKVTLNWSLNNK